MNVTSSSFTILFLCTQIVYIIKKSKYAPWIFFSPRIIFPACKNVYSDFHFFLGEVIKTSFRNDETYITIYRTWLNIVMHFIIPIGCLAIFNYLVLKRFRETLVVGRQGSIVVQLNSARLKNQETNMTTMMFVVVSVFTFANLFYFLCKFFKETEIIEKNTIKNYLRPFADLLMTLNSSVNVIIYGIFSKRFRKIFLKVIRCKKEDSKVIHSRSGIETQTNQKMKTKVRTPKKQRKSSNPTSTSSTTGMTYLKVASPQAF